MQIEYRRDLNHNYVVLEREKAVQTDGYQVRMILSNDIAGLLPCTIRQMDGQALFCYEMTSRQSLQSLLEHKELTCEQLVRYMGQVLDTIERLQSFLLNPDDLVLKIELVFEDNGGGELSFCYLPEFQHPIRESLRELVEYFLPKIDHKNKQAVAVGYGLYRKIMEKNWNIEELRELLFEHTCETEEKKNADAVPWDEKEPQEIEREQLLNQFFEREEEDSSWEKWVGAAAVCVMALLFVLLRILHISWIISILVICAAISIAGIGYGIWYIQHKLSAGNTKAEKGLTEKTKTSELLILEGEKMVQSDSGQRDKQRNRQKDSQKGEEYEQATELLYKQETITGARLIAVQPSTLQTIFLDKELTLIGTLSQAVDAVIPSGAVSRIHAKIKRINAGYVLADLSSKNGTFVNTHMLIGEEEYLLQEGDEVKFAEVVYRYFSQ